MLLIGAVVLCGLILVAWFPAGALYHQRTSLAQADNQLAQLHRQDVALSQETKSLSDAAVVGRIARQEYQLVSPGQQAFEILPPPKNAPANAPYPGDPGNSAPIAPSGSVTIPVATTTTTQPAATTTQAAAAPGLKSGAVSQTGSSGQGVISRMVQALEFWR